MKNTKFWIYYISIVLFASLSLVSVQIVKGAIDWVPEAFVFSVLVFSIIYFHLHTIYTRNLPGKSPQKISNGLLLGTLAGLTLSLVSVIISYSTLDQPRNEFTSFWWNNIFTLVYGIYLLSAIFAAATDFIMSNVSLLKCIRASLSFFALSILLFIVFYYIEGIVFGGFF